MNGVQMRIILTTKEDVTYPLSPRAIVEWEQKFNKGMAKMLSEDQKFEQLFYLAWLLLRNNGHTPKPFGNDFLDTIENIELLTDPSFE